MPKRKRPKPSHSPPPTASSFNSPSRKAFLMPTDDGGTRSPTDSEWEELEWEAEAAAMPPYEEVVSICTYAWYCHLLSVELVQPVLSAMDYLDSIPLMLVDHVPRLEYAHPRPVRCGAKGIYERITGRRIPCAEEAEWIWNNDPSLQVGTWSKCDCPACPRYACRHHVPT